MEQKHVNCFSIVINREHFTKITENYLKVYQEKNAYVFYLSMYRDIPAYTRQKRYTHGGMVTATRRLKDNICKSHDCKPLYLTPANGVHTYTYHLIAESTVSFLCIEQSTKLHCTC